MELNLPKRTFNPVIQQEQITETEKYVHPFSEEEVLQIKNKYKELQKNGFQNITLEDQKNIIIPHVVIHRTEVFNIKEEKVKVVKEKAERQVRVKKEKEVKGTDVKVKKLTKKQYQDRLMSIIMQKAQGLAISDEDNVFYEEHLKNEESI
jgi:hypothetical protein